MRMMLYGTTVDFASPAGVRQELEEERKKHSESKEGAHAANPSVDTSESREPIGLCDFRVKHPDLTAF